jgi:hypothetical protein
MARNEGTRPGPSEEPGSVARNLSTEASSREGAPRREGLVNLSTPLPAVAVEALGIATTNPLAESRAEPEWEVPNPRVAGALIDLLTIDPAALEQGLRQFLATVQGIREVVPPVVSQPTLAPWLFLTGAALVGCEVARRQVLRRGRRRTPVVHWPLLPGQPLFPEDPS